MGASATLVALGSVMAAAVALALRACVRDIWDGIFAVILFIAIFALAGGVLAQGGETLIMSFGLLPAPAPRGTQVLLGSLVSVNAAMLIACVFQLAARRIGSCRGRT